ncbi:MAG: hypothetical protein ACRDY0_02175 [Acidimicrobiales bacterium]
MPSPREAWVRREIVAGCATALHRIGGPTLPSVGITSCLRGEGRTSVALAAAVVERYAYGRTTILVELDLENASLAGTLGVSPGPGVVEVLGGTASLADALQWPDERLGVLVAGKVDGMPSSLLSRLAGGDLLRQVGSMAEVVVSDLPALPPAGLGLHVAGLCSTVLLVVRAGVTPIGHIQKAVVALEKPPWVVLNATGTKVPRWMRAILGR